MIYTIGYQRLTPERLQEIIEGLDALLFDVRYVPSSRKKGFSATSLRNRFDWRYQTWGTMLGGRGHTTLEGIAGLAKVHQTVLRPVVLMCMEEAPGECHRHAAICGRNFPDAVHIFQDQLVKAFDLQESFDDDIDDYPIIGTLEQAIKQARSRQEQSG